LLLGLCLLGAVLAQHRAYREPPARPLRSAILLHLCAALALPFTSTDLYSNLAYGWLARAGHNPYLTGPRVLGERAALVGPRWTDTPTVYGPLAQAVDWLAAAAPDIWGAMGLFKLAMLATAVSLVLVAWRFTQQLPEPLRSRSFLLVAWSPLIAWEISAQAHNDGLLLVGTAAFVWAAHARREWLATIFLAAMLCTKLAALPVAGLYLCMVARRSPLRAGGMASLLVAIVAALYAPFWEGAGTLTSQWAVLRGDPTNHTRSFIELGRWLVAPLGPGAQAGVVSVGTVVGRVLLAATAVLGVIRATSLERVLRWSCIFVLVNGLLAAAAFQPWYVTWLLPLGMAEADARWQRVYSVYAGLTVIQYGLDLDPVTYLVVNGIPLLMLGRLVRPAVTRWFRAPGGMPPGPCARPP
jgi:hypothetical protein